MQRYRRFKKQNPAVTIGTSLSLTTNWKSDKTRNTIKTINFITREDNIDSSIRVKNSTNGTIAIMKRINKRKMSTIISQLKSEL